MSSLLPIYTVNAFSGKASGGNPAAVCLLEKEIPDISCQKIAFESNLSEMAFINPMKESDFKTGNKFSIRWFTPPMEEPLCCHATLAAAHILFNEIKNTSPAISFQNAFNDLRCVNGGDGTIQMRFPEWKILRKLEGSDLELYAPLVKECVGDLPVSALWYTHFDGATKLIIILDEKVDRPIFESLKPDSDRLCQFDQFAHVSDHKSAHVKGICVTMKGTTGNGCVDEKGTPYHFVSSYFAPWTGIPDAPVTGLMHCALGPLWSKLLGEKKLYARQCSPRGSELNIELKDEDEGAVYLSGTAVTVISDQIAV